VTLLQQLPTATMMMLWSAPVATSEVQQRLAVRWHRTR
jgi:hypothetical protein